MEPIKIKFKRRHIENVERTNEKPKIIVINKKLDNGELVDSWLPYNTVREREIFEEGILFGRKQYELKK